MNNCHMSSSAIYMERTRIWPLFLSFFSNLSVTHRSKATSSSKEFVPPQQHPMGEKDERTLQQPLLAPDQRNDEVSPVCERLDSSAVKDRLYVRWIGRLESIEGASPSLCLLTWQAIQRNGASLNGNGRVHGDYVSLPVEEEVSKWSK